MDSPELVNAFAAAAIRSMAESNIPHTPQNFTVWYDYHSNHTPELVQLIDIYLSNRCDIDESTIASLYERFYRSSNEYEAIRDISQRMQESLQQALGLIVAGSDDAVRFGSAVRAASGQFAARGFTLPELIQSLLAEAKDMAERSNRLSQQLQETNEKVKNLEQTLDATRKEAITDALTGLVNRRHFDQLIRQMAGKAMNDGHDVALLLVDIDHFKAINDTWGHPVGDQVIQLISSTIKNRIRVGDTAARYGGEEFAVLLPQTSLTAACDVGNQLRCAFEGQQVVLRDSKQVIGKVTVSVGAACYDPGEPLLDWIRRTDAALYQAKTAGRNRLVAAPHPSAAR